MIDTVAEMIKTDVLTNPMVSRSRGTGRGTFESLQSQCPDRDIQEEWRSE